MGGMRENIIVIALEGKNEFQSEKMQGAGIREEIVSEAGLEDLLPRCRADGRTSERAKCYVVGPPEFQDKVKKTAKNNNVKWQIISCSSESEMMEKEKISFPEEAKEEKKEGGNGEIRGILDKYKNCGISESEIAGIMMTAEDISESRIFPDTFENRCSALLKTAETYIPDPERAKAAAAWYVHSGFMQ